MMNICLMISVLDRDRQNEFMEFYENMKVSPVLTFPCRGTATKKQLSLLELEETQKTLIAGVISGAETDDFFKKAKKESMIDVAGNGVMLSVPIKSVIGVRSLNYLTGERKIDKEVPDMNFNKELIVVIANGGYTEDIMDTARRAGASGGTVIHAKGTGAKIANKFFGISLAEEKEVILIAETGTKKHVILKSIAENNGPETPSGAVCFSVPISEIAGIRNLEDIE